MPATRTRSQCLTSRACDTPDDACFASAAATFVTEPAVVAYRAACNAKKTACDGADASTIPEAYCGVEIGLLPEALIASMERCFAGGGSEVESCVAENLRCADTRACFLRGAVAVSSCEK